MRTISVFVVVALAVAGCSGSRGKQDADAGDLVLQITDSLAGGRIELQGVYLRGTDGYVQALDNGTDFDFKGTGGNVSATGSVPDGTYDRLRLAFASVESGASKAILAQTGVEVAVNITVTKAGNTTIGLAFAWADSFFPTEDGGLAFTPILSRLLVTVDGAETVRLEAGNISTGGGKAPVARMRVFDATGLEAFASTFVADSPEKPVIANSGNITLTATQSEALQPGATLAKSTWDITGANSTRLVGNTVKWESPVSGGNHTVRLTVEDSDGRSDTQTVTFALKPGLATRLFNFTGVIDRGVGGCTPPAGPAGSQCPAQGIEEHLFPVDVNSVDGAPANLTHVRLVLAPGDATVPVADLDVSLDDAADKRIGAQTGQGSQHTIDVDVTGVASGDWKILVTGDPAYGASYTVSVTLTWKGVNPGMEAFLASYEDGHSHEH